MSESTQKPKRQRWPGPMSLVLLMTVAVSSVYWGTHHGSPAQDHVKPGELIDVAGTYVSPDGVTVLKLEDIGNSTMIDVQISCSEGGREIGSVKWQADAALPWMYMFDEDSKLWGYSRDRGPHSFQRSPKSITTTAIGSGGGWEGIPESFRSLLPEESRKVYAEWFAKQPKFPNKENG